MKKIILGTLDAWLTSRLSHRQSKPAYCIVDWRISSSKGNPNLTPLKTIFCSNLMLLPFESFHRIKCLALWKNQPTYSQLDLYHYHKFFWYQCCLEDKLEWNRKVHFMGYTWQSFSVNLIPIKTKKIKLSVHWKNKILWHNKIINRKMFYPDAVYVLVHTT